MPINFKNLANSDKDIRDSELELLFKEMPCSQALMDANWKAIFYCFWMSDKPKVQEELAIKIASKVLDFGEMYLLTFWDTLIREWYQIDRIRLNKYYMLIRKFHYFMFEWIKDNEFDGSIFPKIIAKITPVLGILYNATENIFTICAESWENTDIKDTMIEELLMPFVELLSNKNVVLIDKLVNELFLSLPKNTVLSKNVNFPRFAPVLYRKVNNAATPETKEIIDVGFKEFAKLVGVPYKIVNVVTGMKRVVEEKIVGAADTVDSATEAPKSKKLKTATPVAFSNQNEVVEVDDPQSKSKSKSKLVKNTATHSVMELDNTDEIVNSSKKSSAGSQPDKAHIRKAVDLKSTNDIEKKKVTSGGTVVQKAKENLKGGDSDKSAKSKKKRANEKPESKLSKEVGKEVETTINEDKKVSNTSKLEPSQRVDKSQGNRKKPQDDLKKDPKIEIQASDNDTKKAVPKLEDDDGSSNSWEDDRRVSWSSKLRVKSFRKTSTLSVDQVSLDAKPKKSVLKPFGKLYIKSSKSGAKAKKRNKN